MAGVPFEPIERLATSTASIAARELLIKRAEFAQATVKLGQHPEPDLLETRRSGGASVHSEGTSNLSNIYSDCLSRLSRAESDFDGLLRSQVTTARQSLFDAAHEILPGYLIFAGKGMAKWLEREFPLHSDFASRNKKIRDYERTFL